MTYLKIKNEKYVLIPEKNYHALQKKAALKSKTEPVLSLQDARSYSKKLIRQWAKEK
jgi:hypothetical protein